MLLPNKLYTYEESVLSKFPVILKSLQTEPKTVTALYSEIRKKVAGTSEYLEILDSLYALGKIEFDDEKGVLKTCSMK